MYVLVFVKLVNLLTNLSLTVLGSKFPIIVFNFKKLISALLAVIIVKKESMYYIF